MGPFTANHKKSWFEAGNSSSPGLSRSIVGFTSKHVCARPFEHPPLAGRVVVGAATSSVRSVIPWNLDSKTIWEEKDRALLESAVMKPAMQGIIIIIIIY